MHVGVKEGKTTTFEKELSTFLVIFFLLDIELTSV